MENDKKLLCTELVGSGQDADGEFDLQRDVYDDMSATVRWVRGDKTIGETSLQFSKVNMEVK